MTRSVSLIRHMAEAEPDFLARLKRTFGRGYTLGQDDHDFISTQQYGEHFIEAIEKAVRAQHDPR